ncbi:hypothetical protein [Argonema antarcticum]|uniref:hypothetical protein n=1 Tax=Argonema antarcticum TaxID=2942763 RepID=UPI00201150BB|nr:hypothetical protein [Argonema antarcticum]MCL1474268.1 hypothetical protein [Argonema antarcticum A004/B2]
MNPVSSYELDREVFQLLNPGEGQLDNWQGAASGIADYVASWGVERFWAMSRSRVLLGGEMPNAATGSDEEKRYFAWGVARVVLCKIVGTDLRIEKTMTTEAFQNRFRELDFNQQVLLTDLLMEISDTIQFWTMRLKDAKKCNTQV